MCCVGLSPSRLRALVGGDRLDLTKALNSTVILRSDTSCRTFAPRLLRSLGGAAGATEGGRPTRPLGQHTPTMLIPSPLSINKPNPSRHFPK